MLKKSACLLLVLCFFIISAASVFAQPAPECKDGVCTLPAQSNTANSPSQPQENTSEQPRNNG